jgi:hypothetical protein
LPRVTRDHQLEAPKEDAAEDLHEAIKRARAAQLRRLPQIRQAKRNPPHFQEKQEPDGD